MEGRISMKNRSFPSLPSRRKGALYLVLLDGRIPGLDERTVVPNILMCL